MATTITPGNSKQQVAQAITSGGEIYFEQGLHIIETSPESPGITISRHDITLRGDNKASIMFDGNGLGIHAKNIMDLKINGLDLRYRDALALPWQMLVDLRGCSNVDIDNCTFSYAVHAVRAGMGGSDRYGSGYGPSRDVTIRNCTARDIRGPVFFTKFGGCEGFTVANCEITNFAHAAIAVQEFPLDGDTGTSSRSFIQDNIIKQGSGNAIVLSGSNIWCERNVIDGMTGDGAQIGIRITVDPLRLSGTNYKNIWVNRNHINIQNFNSYGILYEFSPKEQAKQVFVTQNVVNATMPHASMFVASIDNALPHGMVCDQEVFNFRTRDWRSVSKI